MSGTEIFRISETEFLDLINEANRDIDVAQGLSGEQHKSIVKKIKKALDLAQNNIRNMEMEANSLDIGIKQQLKKAITSHKKDLRQLLKDVENLKSKKSKSQLLGGYEYDNDMVTSDDYKQRLVNSTQRLDRSTDHLKRSIAILDETEQTAIETSSRLKAQGDQIRGATAKVQDIRTDVNRGGRVISRMFRREIMNKIILLLVIFVLIAIIFLIILFILRNPLIAILKLIFGSKEKKE